MLAKRVIIGIVGAILLCMMPVVAMAQDFRVNSPIFSLANSHISSIGASCTSTNSCGLTGYGCYNSNYMRNTSNMECYKAITHTMPSMSQLSSCSTVLRASDEDLQSLTTQNPGRRPGIRRVSEDDHNADPFIPIGDTPWMLFILLAIGYGCYKLRKRSA